MNTRIFGIGLSRTGTLSLATALNHLGFNTVHWPLSLAAIDGAEAATDITVTCRYKELDQEYPGSKFIYTTREMESWLTSVMTHYTMLNNSPPYIMAACLRFALVAEQIMYGRVSYKEIPNREVFRHSYLRHDADVKEYFSGRENDLLIVDITKGEGWDKIAPFVGKDIPATPFPHAHQRKIEVS